MSKIFVYVLEQYLHNFTDDDDDEEQPTKLTSPSREVSPKFVVAGKKYGRRSRPPSDTFDSSQSDTDPECTSNDIAIVPTAANHQRQYDSTKITSTSATTTKTTQKVKVMMRLFNRYTEFCRFGLNIHFFVWVCQSQV